MHFTIPKSGWLLISFDSTTLKQSNGQIEICITRPAKLPIEPLTTTKCFQSCLLSWLQGEADLRKRVKQRWMSSLTVNTPIFEGRVLSKKYCTPLNSPKKPYYLITRWKVLVTVEQGTVMVFLTMSSGVTCNRVLTSSIGLESAMATETIPIYLRYRLTSISKC